MTQITEGISNKKTRVGWRALLMHRLVTFSQPLYRRWSCKQQIPWEISTQQLLSYPVNSLGQTLGQFLQKHDYTLMAQFESHDVFHVLLGYEPSVLDEARMQYCLLASGRHSIYTLGTCVLAGIVYPEYCLDFRRHYQYGRNLKDFSYWNFETMLSIDIKELRRNIFR